jgi:hypothetical protein
MDYKNVTVRKSGQKWKLWRYKQDKRWNSFGKRLSDKARHGIMNELGWISYIKRISILASSTPPILISVLLHDEWFKSRKSITKMRKRPARDILLR